MKKLDSANPALCFCLHLPSVVLVLAQVHDFGDKGMGVVAARAIQKGLCPQDWTAHLSFSHHRCSSNHAQVSCFFASSPFFW